MKNVFAARLVAVGLLFIGFGCCHNKPPLVEPEEITLQNALESVGEGLRLMNAAARPVVTVVDQKGKAVSNGTKTFGLFANECVVTFNIKAGQKSETAKRLVLDLNAAPPAIAAGLGAKASASVATTQSSEAERGNTIVIKFTNPIFAAKDTAMFQAVGTTQPATGKSTLGRVLDDILAVIDPAAFSDTVKK